MSIPRKLKPCTDCGSPSYIFSHGRCKNCAQLAKLREGPKEQVTLVQTDSKPAKPFRVIKKVSDKQAKLNAAYNAMATVYKKEHPMCKAQIIVCTGYTTDVHHKKGRGEYLMDATTWLPVCRACHDWIGTHHERAMELGLVESRLSK